MELEKIASFKVDHLKLLPGVYVSRKDSFGGAFATTFDIRVTVPNKEPAMEISAIHTIEHLGATYLRSSAMKDEVIYFGPMGCRTGFYFVVFGDKKPEDVYEFIKGQFEFIAAYEGVIPGVDPVECGNYHDHNLELAKYYAAKYLIELKQKRFVYPK